MGTSENERGKDEDRLGLLVTFHKLTAWITRFVDIVIGDTSDTEWNDFIERTQKIRRIVILEEKFNKILSSTSEL